MNTTATSRRSRRLFVTVALAAIALGATACGSSSSSSTSTTAGSNTTTSSSATTSSTATATSAPSAAALTEAEAKLSAGETATFIASYKVSSTTAGKTTNVPFTIAHEGSNALFSVVEGSGSFEEIGIGSKAIVCAETGTTWKCFSGSYGQTLGASLSALTDLYGSKAALTTLKADESSSSDVTQSSKTVAGQNVSCWTFHAASNGGVYTDCVTSNGVLAEEYGQSATTKFQVVISKFSTTVPSSEFTPPATPTSTPG